VSRFCQPSSYNDNHYVLTEDFQEISVRDIKHWILENKIDGLYNKLHKAVCLNPNKSDHSKYYEYMFLSLDYTNDIILANAIRIIAEQLNSAKYARYKRIRDRISDMFDIWDCTFITLTFEDKYLDSSLKTKKEYCKRFLSSFEMPYVANVDYGKINGRVHFHAVIATPREEIDANPWKYGFQYCESCRTDTDDEKRLAKYVSKLSAHALKSTTKNSRLIYSRNFDKLLQQYIKRSLT
jgi:hypothetical protein